MKILDENKIVDKIENIITIRTQELNDPNMKQCPQCTLVCEKRMNYCDACNYCYIKVKPEEPIKPDAAISNNSIQVKEVPKPVEVVLTKKEKTNELLKNLRVSKEY